MSKNEKVGNILRSLWGLNDVNGEWDVCTCLKEKNWKKITTG